MINDEDWVKLLRACSANDTQAVVKYLSQRTDPNYQHPDFRTSPFFVAVHAGHFQCVQLLLQVGASANNVEIRSGLTPVQLALQQGHHAIVDILLTRLSGEEQRKNGIKTILVSGSMRKEMLYALAASGHTILVDDDHSVGETIQEIQVATKNSKIQPADMIKSELTTVTDFIIREVEGVSMLEYLADCYPSMTNLERILVITTQTPPSTELSWLLRSNNKVAALVVPFRWDTLFDFHWLAKWHGTVLFMLTTNDPVQGKVYNYRRQIVATPALPTPANDTPSETDLWNVKYKALMSRTPLTRLPSKAVFPRSKRQLQQQRQQPSPDKKRRHAVVPWNFACYE